MDRDTDGNLDRDDSYKYLYFDTHRDVNADRNLYGDLHLDCDQYRYIDCYGDDHLDFDRHTDLDVDFDIDPYIH